MLAGCAALAAGALQSAAANTPCPPLSPRFPPLQVFKAGFKSTGASLRSLFRSSKGQHQRLPDGDDMEEDGR